VVLGTERVTVWLLPAATVNGAAGEVVVPLGSPVRLTDTEPVNPFRLVIETAKLELEVPATAVTAVGERAMAKSCADVTVNVRFAECVKTPDVPLTVTV
jgi:hypothetical protein